MTDSGAVIAAAYEILRCTENLPVYAKDVCNGEVRESDDVASCEGKSLDREKTRDGEASLWEDDFDESQRSMPKPPADSKGVRYQIFPKCRVIKVDLSGMGSAKVAGQHQTFIMQCLDRSDITVILRGLFAPLDQRLWTWDYLVRRCGHMMYHAFKVFEWSDAKDRFEPSGWISMSIADYDRYLKLRHRLSRCRCDTTASQADDESKRFVKHYFENDADKNAREVSPLVPVTTATGEVRTIDAGRVSVYLIDLPLPTYLPELMVDLQSKARLDLLPSGKRCMQRFIAPSSRPFMGPNLYVTPPGASTYFHEDGHGTVDSGHLAMTGFNEVIMLRRLGQKDKVRALDILRGDVDYRLRVEPHDDSVSKIKPAWPGVDVVDALRGCGYEPSHFVLQPGEYVHINKGRMHAFRKVFPMATDAFVRPASARETENATFRRQMGTSAEVCISVAWDWIFQGHSARAVRQEAAVALENARENCKDSRPVFSLGRTEAVVIGALTAAMACLRAGEKEAGDDSKCRKSGPFWATSWTEAKPKSRAVNATARVVKSREEAVRIIRGLGDLLCGHIGRSYAKCDDDDDDDDDDVSRESVTSEQLEIALRIFESAQRDMERVYVRLTSNPAAKVADESLTKRHNNAGDTKGEDEEKTMHDDAPSSVDELRRVASNARSTRSVLRKMFDATLARLRRLARRQLFEGTRSSSNAILSRMTLEDNDFDDMFVDVAVPKLRQTVDPFHSDGFTCEICYKELSNVYYHCLGCEFLKKDFNVCVDCRKCARHEVTARDAKTTTDGHRGAVDWSIRQRPGKVCSKHRQRSCKMCGFCIMCSCRCHSVLQKRYRFCGGRSFVKFIDSVVCAADRLGHVARLEPSRSSKTCDRTFRPHRCVFPENQKALSSSPAAVSRRLVTAVDAATASSDTTESWVSRLKKNVGESRIFDVENPKISIARITSGALQRRSQRKRSSSKRRYVPKIQVRASTSGTFDCECGRTFTMAKALRVHLTKKGHLPKIKIASADREEDKDASCTIVSSSAAAASDAAETPFPCLICGRTFAASRHLSIHMHFHRKKGETKKREASGDDADESLTKKKKTTTTLESK